MGESRLAKAILPWNSVRLKGRRFRVFALVDDFTRECLGLVVDTSLSGVRVARELSAIIEQRGRPCMVVSDSVLSQED